VPFIVTVLLIFPILSSQESMQQSSAHHDVAMDLINSVTGVDDEGRSRQRILSFAGKRFANLA
jgi:cytochrome c-type biogenesis protein CcmH/NrfF